MNDIILRDAVVHFEVANGVVRALDYVTAHFKAGKITGIIGESGCGKSVLGLSVLGLLPPYAKAGGEILFGELNITTAGLREVQALRGRQIGLIPQNPSDSLNPVRTVGSQLTEALSLIEKNKNARYAKAVKLLADYGFDDPERIMRAYPFELSGGMQQRALCALGVCCSPKWVLADEPTKGLDRQLCEQVAETLTGLKAFGVESMLIITHDLEVALLCDEIAVMYAGEIVEMGTDALRSPSHPYTRAFLKSLPQNGMHPMMGMPPAPGFDSPGCKFAPRCPECGERCLAGRPPAYPHANGITRCFLYA